MLVLSVDTSTRVGSVAFLKSGRLVEAISGRDDIPYSTRLFEDVARLQSSAAFRIAQIDLFAVVTGPGSFTGLRVGLAAVKAWAEVYNKPIAAIGCLEAIAAQAIEPSETVAAFLDARRGHVFCGIYRRESFGGVLYRASDDAILSVEEALALVRRTVGSREVILATSSPEILPLTQVAAIIPQARIERVSACLAPIVGQLGILHAERGELTDAAGLNANYVRRSDAEVGPRVV